MNYPKITVVTPSYNQGKFLEETILSVIDQNYPDLEYIIMDGGSTDNSVEIIKRYEKHLAYWQSRPDDGQSAAINEGFKRATGDVYCWLNSDDQFTEGALKIVGEYFQNNADCLWLCGIGELKTLNRKKKIRKCRPKKLNFEAISNITTRIAQPGVFWRNKLWEKTSGLNERFNYAFDFDLWVQFSLIAEGHILDFTLSTAYMYPGQKSQAGSVEYFIEACLSLYERGFTDLAIKKLARPIRRASEISNALSFITKNKIYRLWRDRRETKRK
ncbi:MAG: glycosyltransferase family 2 protein [Bacteroidota bacterium]